MARGDGELLAAALDRGPERQAAWDELVTRHTPRLFAVARSFRLDQAEAADVVQTAWLRLLERGEQVRDADLLGPWLATVVRNEARRLVSRRRIVPTEVAWDRAPDPHTAPTDERLLRAERAAALRVAFARLGEECAQLLRLLTADPPLAYAEIAATVGRPIGAIGPTRQRCLDQLRRHLPRGVE